MQRLISLFAAAEHEPRLSQPPSGPPPGPPGPDYAREPEYFRHLLDYLRAERAGDPAAEAVDPDALIGQPEEAFA